MNNCVGREFVTDDDMEYAVDDYLENSQRESLIETRGANAKATGWYSIVLSLRCLRGRFNRREHWTSSVVLPKNNKV